MTKLKYQIEFAPAAKRQIKKIPKRTQKLLIDCIESLQLNPRPDGVKKLVNKTNLYRIRVDDHRIIYKIEDDVLLVLIVKVGNRKDIYRRLHELK